MRYGEPLEESERAQVKPLGHTVITPKTAFDPELEYYADGTRVVARTTGVERYGIAFGMTEGSATMYGFQAIRWDDGGEDLVAPHVVYRAEQQEALPNLTANVVPVLGGKVHKAIPQGLLPHPWPKCRTGGQDKGGTKYRHTTQEVNCKNCGPVR